MTTLAHDFAAEYAARLKAAHTGLQKSLPMLVRHAGVIEVRAFRSGKVESGYFDAAHLHEAIEAMAMLDARDAQVFVTLNPCVDALIARSANRLRAVGKSPLTGDADVSHRVSLLIDVDAIRPSDTSSSDTQHAAASAKATVISDALRALGWPEPIIADSGNGAHVVYAIDLPNDRGSTELVRNVLAALADRFDDPEGGSDRVIVDRSVFNAARICTAWGTVKRKGSSMEKYPHRRSGVVSVPDERVTVSVELLTKLVDMHAAKITIATPTARASTANGGRYTTVGSGEAGRQELAEWIERHGLNVIREDDKGDVYQWVLDACPWNETHQDAAISHGPHGRGFKCFHASCADHNWHSLRKHVEGRERDVSYPMPANLNRATIVLEGPPTAANSEFDLTMLRDAVSHVDPASKTQVGKNGKQIDAWYAVGMGLHWESGGADAALALWQE